MAVVVGVHGIGQQNRSAERLTRAWSDALMLGTAAAGLPDKPPTLTVSFYGHLFRRQDGRLGPGDDEPLTLGEIEFIASVLDDAPSDPASANIPQPPPELGPPALFPAPLLQGLLAIDAHWPRAGMLLVRVLRQVYAYLTDATLAECIRGIVARDIEHDTRVLVGHSLGAAISYDLMCRGLAPTVPTLVTIGSPLAWPTVMRALHATPAAEPTPVDWLNVFDPGDAVTAGRGLNGTDARLSVTDAQVDNGWRDPHAVVAYLKQPATARPINVAARSAGVHDD